MLSWLKRRAKVTINNRYINIFRSNDINSTNNMFVSDTQTVSLMNDHILKLKVVDMRGQDYPLEVPSGFTVDRLKVMAVGRFYGLGEAVQDDRPGATKDSKCTGNRSYRFVSVRNARPLSDESTLHFEKLIDNDVLLLVERREPPPQPKESSEESSSPTLQEIERATAYVPKRNENRDPNPSSPSSDFQTELRRILITMIMASVRLISADPESKAVFAQILDKLEKRHRPRVDRNHLHKLIEMGFDETRATKALQAKKGLNEAMEWLLDNVSVDDGDVKGTEVAAASSVFTTDKNAMEDLQEDPARTVLRQFLQYRKKWFVPNQQALERFQQMGFPRDRIVDALRVTGNNASTAESLLVDNKPIPPDDEGLDRSSPIISAILASPVIQLALPKPKTLLALMMLFESPNNANMWLSDPDTHPVVSQVLRIYHAEKHSLNHNRATPATSSSESPKPFARSSTPPRTSSSSSPVAKARNVSRPTQSFTSAEARSLTPSSSNVPVFATVRSTSSFSQPQGDLSSSSSSTRESRYDFLFKEEPMSHSGSPVRAMANGGPYMSAPSEPLTTVPNDVEMEDTAQDSLDMETQ